jgi:hypothetical protein
MTASIATFLQGQDEFGEQVQLTYKGQNKHGTAVGGICSILANLVFFVFFIMQMEKLIFNPDTDTERTEEDLTNMGYTTPTMEV